LHVAQVCILELKIGYTKLIFSSKPVLKNDKLSEQEMPRAAKDLLRRQLAMKKKSTLKKPDKKKKKQGTNEAVFYVDTVESLIVGCPGM